MYDLKQNVAAFVPVRIFNAGGEPVAGIGFGSIIVTVVKSNGSTQSVTPTISDWLEITTGAFSGAGVYSLQLPASALDTVGYINYAVSVTGQKTFVGSLKVVSAEAADIAPILGTPAFGSVSADLADVKTSVNAQSSTLTTINNNVTTVNNNVTVLRKYEEGRWKIFTSGIDANRLVIYDTDGVTPLVKFDLKDSSGSSTFVNPFERVKVP